MANVDIKDVKKRILSSEKYMRRYFIDDKRPKQMSNYFQGKHYDADMPLADFPVEDKLIINYSMVNVLNKMARITFGDPNVVVVATNKASFAKQLDTKRTLEYVWKEIEATPVARNIYRDMKVYGTGFGATGWRFISETEAFDDLPIEKEAEIEKTPTFESAMGDILGQQNPTPTKPKEQKFGKIKIITDEPVLRRVKPWNMLLDPDTPDNLQKGMWCGEKIVIPLAQVRQNKKYAEVSSELTGTTKLLSEESNTVFDLDKGDFDDLERDAEDGVTIYILYLKDKKCRVEWTPELPSKLLYVGEEMGVDYPIDDRGVGYFPYLSMVNIDDLESAYGISDIAVTESQQIEINAGRSQIASRRRRDGTIYVADTRFITADDINALKDAPDGLVISADKLAGNTQPGMVIQPVTRQPIQPEVYASIDKARMDFSELSGVSADERGMVIGAPSATESAMIAASSSSRLGLDRISYECFVAGAISQIAYLLFRHGDGELSIPDMQEEGQFLETRGIDLAGRYKFMVAPASMDKPDWQQRQMEKAQQIQLLSQFIPLGLDIKEVLRQYMELADLENVDMILANVQNPNQAPTPSPVGIPPTGMPPEESNTEPMVPGVPPGELPPPNTAMDAASPEILQTLISRALGMTNQSADLGQT